MTPGNAPLVPRDRWFTARGFLFRQPARRLRDYPWWPVGDAIRLLRYITALLFIAHASIRFVDDTIHGNYPLVLDTDYTVASPGGVLTISFLAAGLRKLDLVTREEFDVQRAVLLRTREQVEALEHRVTELETAAGARH